MNDQPFPPDLRLPCSCLRSKEMYYQSAADQEDEFSSGVYWCTRTHETFGPDGEPVQKKACGPDRACYSAG